MSVEEGGGLDGGFAWPWQYNFPPFFTIQPNEATRAKQLSAWRSLVLDYCQKNRITVLDIREAAASSPLFHNKRIERQLDEEEILIVLRELEKHGNLEWTDKSKRRCSVYWRSPEEWGSLIYQFAKENGLTNTVCTIYELQEGDDAAGQPFHGLDTELLIKSLKSLEIKNQCELFDGNEGVKFL